MPTKKKRIGFIPRDDVVKIIEKLSIEHNLSTSKIISLLVEEALSKRGIYNIRTGKEINNNIENNFLNLKSDNYSKNNENEIRYENKIENRNEFDSFDFITYEKFILFMKFQAMMRKYES